MGNKIAVFKTARKFMGVPKRTRRLFTASLPNLFWSPGKVPEPVFHTTWNCRKKIQILVLARHHI